VQAWWNAESIGEYWTLWNMPVHHWMIRHVYIPIRSRSGSRYLGILASFFVSAIFHEVLIAVPLHRIKGYAFFGMLGQVGALAALQSSGSKQCPHGILTAPYVTAHVVAFQLLVSCTDCCHRPSPCWCCSGSVFACICGAIQSDTIVCMMQPLMRTVHIATD